MSKIDLSLANHILEGANSQAGLGFLEYYAPHKVFHPAWDLNKDYGDQDLGLPLRMPTRGEKIWEGYHSGFGNHAVYFHKHLNLYSHWLHLLEVGLPDVVKANEHFARLGKSGTKYAHCHLEVWTPELYEMQKNRKNAVGVKIPFTIYPRNWEKAKVASLYVDPAIYIKKALEYEKQPVQAVANDVRIYLYRDEVSGKIYIVRDGVYHHIYNEEVFNVLFGGFAGIKWADGSPLNKEDIGEILKLSKK